MANRKSYRMRRTVVVLVGLLVFSCALFTSSHMWQQQQVLGDTSGQELVESEALRALQQLEVKGRAPKTGYERRQFGDGWENKNGCDTRNTILYRDLTNAVVNESCKVMSGVLNDPYTGVLLSFSRGEKTSQAVQIDHVVALSNAWQTGAQQLTLEDRIRFANDPLNLLAVDGPANQQKSDSDAATWLPPNKLFRCQYIARQIAVKVKYSLWVVEAEKRAMARVLDQCPAQALPS